MSKEREAQHKRDTEDYAKSLRKDMDKRLGELKVEIDKLQQRATRTLAERPMLALGIAFVAGMAVGVALSKSTD